MGKKEKKEKKEKNNNKDSDKENDTDTDTDTTTSTESDNNDNTSFFGKLNNLSRKAKLYILICVVLLVVGGYMWYKNRKSNVQVQNITGELVGGGQASQANQTNQVHTQPQLPPMNSNPIQTIQLTQQMSQTMPAEF